MEFGSKQEEIANYDDAMATVFSSRRIDGMAQWNLLALASRYQ